MGWEWGERQCAIQVHVCVALLLPVTAHSLDMVTKSTLGSPQLHEDLLSKHHRLGTLLMLGGGQVWRRRNNRVKESV